MNTNQLKRFAREARIKLLDQIGRKLEYVLTHDSAELRGKQLEIAELRRNINQHGKAHVIDTVAYTWFNRLMALRFMDANGYNVPKVVTPAPGMTNPEILQNAIARHVEEKLNLDRRYLNDLLDNKTASTEPRSEAYRILLVATCNSLHSTMPFMFEPISDYTELLLPDDLLSEYSIVTEIRGGMSDDDCLQEELIGWLYQFYIAQKKDDVFEKLKKNVKITPENIPAATQLFTPRWIVRYMVENTLGKLWLTLRPESQIREHMTYYIESPEGNGPIPVPEDLLLTSHTINNSQLTTIKFLDPCVGSGHVLVYAFDLLAHIYEEEGYNRYEIPSLILTNNLFGIDIDERAAQLAAFALTMKAQSYYNRFLRKPIQPNILNLENIRIEAIEEAIKLPLKVNGKRIDRYTDLRLHLMTEVDNFGSLIQIEPDEYNSINIRSGSIWQVQQIKLKQQAEYLGRKYHCVVTNPPYMGRGGMNSQIKGFVNTTFPKSSFDLMAVFIERCLFFCSLNGKVGLINQQNWMFLSSYEELRPYLIENYQVESLLHLGPRTFPEIPGEVVKNASFILGNYKPFQVGIYFQLTEFKSPAMKEKKVLEGISELKSKFRFTINQSSFANLPGNPFSYWISEKLSSLLLNDTIGDFLISDGQILTGNNEKYLRHLWEINKRDIIDNNWRLHTKGGKTRKWYGNIDKVVKWDRRTRDFYRSDRTARLLSEEYWNRSGIVWNGSSSVGNFAARILDSNESFNKAAPGIFLKDLNDSEYYYLGVLNSIIASKYLSLLSGTNYNSVADVLKIPCLKNHLSSDVEKLVKQNIEISRSDWNSREYSWGFESNVLTRQGETDIRSAFAKYQILLAEKFHIIHKNEEELNRLLIAIYELQTELPIEVPLKNVTILQDESSIIDGKLYIDPNLVLVQLLSYAVGCFFGRFSLDKPGLILANQGEALHDFLKLVQDPKFIPDEDNVIPVLEDEWFTDDIVGRFKVFLKTAFSDEHLEENLKYIEATIGIEIRKYFVRDFYADHIKHYKKHPIYWMFTSPKGHFKALIYMHRYTPDLCSKVLNDYLQPFIGKLDTARQTQVAITIRADVSTREKTKATQRIDILVAMLKDCRAYEKTLFEVATRRIEIDLDDGVKINYQKFKDVLVPIKGLEKEED